MVVKKTTDMFSMDTHWTRHLQFCRSGKVHLRLCQDSASGKDRAPQQRGLVTALISEFVLHSCLPSWATSPLDDTVITALPWPRLGFKGKHSKSLMQFRAKCCRNGSSPKEQMPQHSVSENATAGQETPKTLQGFALGCVELQISVITDKHTYIYIHTWENIFALVST